MAILSGLILIAPRLMRAQILETETARLLPRRTLAVGSNFEYQLSREGKELALPVALEYGLTDTWDWLGQPSGARDSRSGSDRDSHCDS